MSPDLLKHLPFTVLPCQVPHLDGVESSKANLKRRGLPGTLRLLAAGLHDRLRQAAGLDVAPPPAGAHPAVGRLYGGAYVKLVGREDELAIMQLSESELKSYYGKHPPEKQVRCVGPAGTQAFGHTC